MREILASWDLENGYPDARQVFDALLKIGENLPLTQCTCMISTGGDRFLILGPSGNPAGWPVEREGSDASGTCRSR